MAKAHVYKRDHVNTDEIIPARYLNTDDTAELAKHCMEDLDTNFVKKCKPGDVIVCGDDFGCGSSREHAVWSIQGAKVGAVIAHSIARIFYRNCINCGFYPIELPDAVNLIKDGDELEIDYKGGTINDFDFEGYTCPVPIQPKDTVLLGHGSGGKLSHDLINRLFLPELGKAAPRALDDSAVVNINGQRLALTTDSHVVSPLFFAGGDIGKLAVCGTVNDLALVGAKPIALTCGFVIEEGLSFEILQRVVQSMRNAAAEAGVFIAAGDTKVVQKGSADKLFINTAGVGSVEPNINISGTNAQVGDIVIISGTLGDHGIAVMSAREGASS